MSLCVKGKLYYLAVSSLVLNFHRRDAELQKSGSLQLEIIQSRLLDVGSAVATPAETTGVGSTAKKQRVEFDETAASRLEEWIDQMDEELPQLTMFILPSGAMHILRQAQILSTLWKKPLRSPLRGPACCDKSKTLVQ
jgi:hypothetical protein